MTLLDAPVLGEEALERIEGNARIILSEVGIEIHHERARALLKQHGQIVDGTRVHLDPEFVLELVRQAPERFTLHARNPARSVELGGGTLACTNSGGAPFVADLVRGRREGTLADHDDIVRLVQTSDELAIVQCGGTEASEIEPTSRHLDLDRSCLTLSDKPYVCYGTSGEKARDAVDLAAIAFGGRAALAERPAIMGIVNPNSPLVWDELMVDSLWEWAEARQPVVVTPFLLAGATAPVSVAGGLSLQIAEALTGIALVQLISPGAPAVFGSFFSAIDMRTGGPSFGTPEFVLGTLAGGELARRYGVPFRGGGGLCSANVLDGQAAHESAMALWSTFLAGSDLIMHAAGWLEGGLTTSFEKIVLDIESLRMFRAMREGIPVDEEHLALEAIRETGPGGMFLAASHTLEHFREWSFLSPVFRSTAYSSWAKAGSLRADEAATPVWQGMLERYEEPALDDAVAEELDEFIARRRLVLDD